MIALKTDAIRGAGVLIVENERWAKRRQGEPMEKVSGIGGVWQPMGKDAEVEEETESP